MVSFTIITKAVTRKLQQLSLALCDFVINGKLPTREKHSRSEAIDLFLLPAIFSRGTFFF